MRRAFLAAFLSLAMVSQVGAQQVAVDFSGLNEGDSVEGLGTLDSRLNIQNATGTGSVVKIIESGQAAFQAYGALPDNSLKNGCTAATGGFVNVANAQTNKRHDYNFLFPEGVTTFSLRMLDFGDWNPTKSAYHLAEIMAYDADDNLVDHMKLEYTTPTQGNPTDSDAYGPLFKAAGDACNQSGAAPGIWNWTVQSIPDAYGVQYPDIVRIELRFPFGMDPKIGFDNMTFNPSVVGNIEVEIDIKPNSDPNSFSIDGHGVVPVAINGSEDFDVYDVDITTLNFAGLSVKVKGNGNPQCSYQDWNGDGYVDLVCQFVDEPAFWEPGDGVATLTGLLNDGTPFEGTDFINLK